MAVKKLGIDQVPKDMLKDLQTFTPEANKEIVAVGHNFYEITPTSAIQLLEVVSDLFDILEELRLKKIERIKNTLNEKQKEEFDPTLVFTTINDIITDKQAVSQLKDLLPRLLDGVDPDDMKDMTIGQLLEVFDKVIAVNLNTLPPSYRKQLQAMNIASAAEKEETDPTKNP